MLLCNKNLDKSLEDAQRLQENIEELDERLKTKKELDWQDEKLMNDILEQKESLTEKLEELKRQNEQNNSKQESNLFKE